VRCCPHDVSQDVAPVRADVDAIVIRVQQERQQEADVGMLDAVAFLQVLPVSFAHGLRVSRHTAAVTMVVSRWWWESGGRGSGWACYAAVVTGSPRCNLSTASIFLPPTTWAGTVVAALLVLILVIHPGADVGRGSTLR
jgi:hypothetical protein